MSDLITLPRATVRQALEAWEHINKYGFVLADYEGPMEQAITALRAALAEPEPWVKSYCGGKPNYTAPSEQEPHFRGDFRGDFRGGLEQPEQAEPVEIKPPNPEGATQCIVRWFAETPAGWVGARDREALEQFTHPPRREWRGLTEEDIWTLAANSMDSVLGRLHFARAIEARLKEKNHE